MSNINFILPPSKIVSLPFVLARLKQNKKDLKPWQSGTFASVCYASSLKVDDIDDKKKNYVKYMPG